MGRKKKRERGMMGMPFCMGYMVKVEEHTPYLTVRSVMLDVRIVMESKRGEGAQDDERYCITLRDIYLLHHPSMSFFSPAKSTSTIIITTTPTIPYLNKSKAMTTVT